MRHMIRNGNSRMMTRMAAIVQRIVLLALCSSVFAHAQDAEWTVRCFEGSTGGFVTLTECEIVSVTSDSLYVISRGENKALRLYLVYELFHANHNNSYLRTVLLGAAIGVTAGFAVSLYVKGANDNAQPNATAEVAALFGVIGAGLGLEKAVDADYTRYRFPSSTNPEKRAVIQTIIDGKGGHE